MIALPAKSRILVIALRRIGDVLLTTPLIRSLRRAWPEASLEALVFSDTTGILNGNPDLDRVIVADPNAGAMQSAMLAARLARRYALAVSTQSGDRPTFLAAIAGWQSVAPISGGNAMASFKRRIVTHEARALAGVHRVEEVLQLADAVGAARVPHVVVPQGQVRDGLVPAEPYAVLHPSPMYRYKQWTQEGWRGLAAALAQRGLRMLITGGPAASERAYIDSLFGASPEIVRLDGRLAWQEIAALTASAKVFVGPDTSVTHLAVAGGAPTVALFGPTDPRLWGPWPVGGLVTPWAKAGTIQRRGNVWLVQNPLSCLPCQQEGCERHLGSFSQCLDELALPQVLAAVDQALAAGKTESGAVA